MKPGVLEGPGVLGKQDAVRRHGEIAESGLARKLPDQLGQVATQERLPAREPDLVHAEADEHVDEHAHLLEVQDLVARQPRVLLLRHAVLAAQVAAVRDRQAQVAERPAEEVSDARHDVTTAVADSACARSHSRTSPAFLTPTSKWSHGIRSATSRARVV